MALVSLTLLADGSSDRVLMPLIDALMNEHCPLPFVTQFAEGLWS